MFESSQESVFSRHIKACDKARNEQQKTMLLNEALRIASERALRLRNKSKQLEETVRVKRDPSRG